jgi:hypothetical protein
MALGLAVLLALVCGVRAADEVTLKGTITCAKCDLGKTDECATVIKVKDGDKDVLYFFDKDGESKYHKDICKKAKEGSVTGTVTEKDGKKTIKVTKVDYK